MNIRRTEGEILRKYQGEDSPNQQASLEKESDSVMEPVLMMNRERCIPVIRGLMALVLSMDFTCNVDLFVVSCKVIVSWFV